MFLSPCRFDLIAKYLYVKSKDKNLNTDFYKELYHKHFITFNGCKELPDITRGEKGITKNNIDDFINSFDNLIENIKKNGFDERFPIPIGNNGVIINGAHRLVTSYYYNIIPKTININEDGNTGYNYRFFLNRTSNPYLEGKYADTMALEYINHNPNVRTMVIYPVAYDIIKLNKIIEIIKKYGNIYYHKIIKLDANGINNLIKEMYRSEEWIGGMFPNGWSPGGKAQRCISDNPLVYISIVMNDINKCIELKEKCREVYNMGKHSLHMSDYTSDTYRISSSLLNKNSLEFLNNGSNDISEPRKKLLLDYFNNNQNNKDDIIITEINDKINSITINEDDEKLYNPDNFYYFNSYKIYKDIKL